MPRQIKSYSGDLYLVPDHLVEEIELYQKAVDVVKCRQYSTEEYLKAVDTMLYYETCLSGWIYVNEI